MPYSEGMLSPDASNEPRAEPAVDDLTTVVVDWNLPEYTVRCVLALIEDGMPPQRIVVVENGATDENWSRVSTELPSCVLVRTDINVGFARANNIGARLLPARAYLLVNNDAFVHRAGSVSALLKALGRQDIGIVVPRLLNADLSLQPSVAPFTTPLVALMRASGLSRFVPNYWQPRVSTHWDHASSRDIEAAVGAVKLVDGHVWARLGGLRETSFMYAEDLDLCWRARKSGWKTWFAGEAEFVHLGGSSSATRWSDSERAERVAGAEAAMIRSHLSPARAGAALAFMRLGHAVRALYYTLAREQLAAAEARAFLRGYSRREVSERGPTGETRVVEVLNAPYSGGRPRPATPGGSSRPTR
jgi:N-acetylglucosaminyl-diphospho-decaprenol L-rhamnosyltransferase